LGTCSPCSSAASPWSTLWVGSPRLSSSFASACSGFHCSLSGEPGLERASCAASLGLSTSDAPRPRTDVAFCHLTRSHACPEEQAGARRSPKRFAAAHRAGWHHSGRARWFGRGLRCTSMRRRVAVMSRGIGTDITDIRTSSASNATAPNPLNRRPQPRTGRTNRRVQQLSCSRFPGHGCCPAFPDSCVERLVARLSGRILRLRCSPM
jgi:hypothetical protein